MENQQTQKSASERLQDLENMQNNILQAVQPVEQMARDMLMFRETIKLLNNKLDAVVKLTNAGQALTAENLNAAMIENNVAELKAKVAKNVADKLLAPSDTVTQESFIVVSESDAAGIVQNPRLQFVLSSVQSEEVQSKLRGTKVGDTIVVDSAGNTVTILEAYDIQIPQAPAAPAEASAETPDGAQYGSYPEQPAQADAQAPAAAADQSAATA